MADVSASDRTRVYSRAEGHCEYCGVHSSMVLMEHQIDHIISLKHGGSSELSNLALSCVLCNKYKGSDVASIDPVTGAIVPLFHPRQDQWTDHFHLQDGRIEGLSPNGRATARLLQFNRTDRIKERS